MMQAILRIIYIIFCSILIHANSFANQYALRFKKLTNQNGLTHNTVLDIAQDSTGTLWIATKEGLNKYNSYDITNYYAETHPEISSNFINTLYVSSDNSVYAGTDAGLNVYNNKLDNFTAVLFNGKPLPDVLTILKDLDGNIFIGTRDGLYKYYPRTGIMVNYSVLKGIPIFSIISDKDQFLLISISNIIVINNDGRIIESYDGNNCRGLENVNLNTIFKNSQGKIYLGTANAGLLEFDQSARSCSSVPYTQIGNTGAKFVRAVNEDEDGNLWIGTEAGLFVFNLETDSCLHIQHSLEDTDYCLNDNAVYCIFASREKMMWIGTYFGGINYTTLHDKKKFLHVSPGIEVDELPGKAVSKLFQSTEGSLWIATEDGGVCLMDLSTKKIRKVWRQQDGNGLSSNNIHSICEDKDGNIWLGHFTKGIDIYNPSLDKFTNLLPNPEFSGQVFGNSVYSLFSDSNDNLWIGTRRNVKKYDFEKKQFVPFKPDQINFFVYHIFESRDNKIWFCTRYNGIICYDPHLDTLIHYNLSSGKGLRSQQVICGTEDSKGRIWFGTIGGGAYVYTPGQDFFQVISSVQGLANNTVYGILEEKEDVMWLSTNRGLVRYNYLTGNIRNYSLEDGLKQMQFNFSSYLKDEQDVMYFGTIDGLTYFNPLEISIPTYEPYVMFTDLLLFNKSVNVDESKIIHQQINSTEGIELKYAQNVITINYVAVNHLSPKTNEFKYYLEGFDKDWNVTRNKTSVTYTNLAPGDYTFHLKAATIDGIESSNVKSLNIKILRPWWFTNVALILYVVMSVAGILFFRKRAIEREKEKARFNLEKLERIRIKQLNQQRLNFFTYITHEFKTPLTIILASVEELFESKRFKPEDEKYLSRLRSSANRLLFLINQLMDFRKVETRHAKLLLHNGDLIQFIKDRCLIFSPVFKKKNIEFIFSSNRENSFNWFDPDKIEKIISNLISNAVKFTPVNGMVKCEVNIISDKDSDRSQSVYIKVSDTGKGIRKEDLKYLFNQYYKVEQGEEYKVGTGLGLSLVKSLVKFLGGEIKVESNPGQGSEFIVHLPLVINKAMNLKLQKEKLIPQNPLELDYLLELEEEVKVEAHFPAKSSHHILIVEDTIDLAKVLIEHFSQEYKVSFCRDGDEAARLIKSEMPDIVLSDVMMPRVDGMELCKLIKENRETSHIIVILLTAKGSHEDKLMGLSHGADAYIAKPFDFKEVDLLVKNALELRSNLRKTILYSKDIDLSKINMHNPDKEIIEKSTSIINQNIGNESFTVEDLTEKLGMSATLVYLKHKKLLDVSPKEYIQMLRFKKAIEFMIGSRQSISEIAYKVGFSDPNYFSKAFKKVYHKTPTQYREQFKSEKQDQQNSEANRF